eukprot:scaffold39906_cov57-Attheya_sp.AAC.10
MESTRSIFTVSPLATAPPRPAPVLSHTLTSAPLLEITIHQNPPTLGLVPSELSQLLNKALAWKSTPTCETEFAFQWTKEAADHNLATLQRYGFDLAEALTKQPFSALTIGSEFRAPNVLAPFSHLHPLWPKVHQMLVSGCDYALQPLTEADRLEDIQANMVRGNHQSAKQHAEERIQQMMESEVTNGWRLILPRVAIFLLPGAVLGSLGIVSQDTISELDEIVPKWRLTHDQSFNVIPKTERSVNDRVIWEELTPYRYMEQP